MTRRSTQSSTVDILDRLSQADSAHSSASASHLCLLAEIQGQVKEINALVKAGSSERRELASALYAEIGCALHQADAL
jgi:hypothetical protein